MSGLLAAHHTILRTTHLRRLRADTPSGQAVPPVVLLVADESPMLHRARPSGTGSGPGSIAREDFVYTMTLAALERVLAPRVGVTAQQAIWDAVARNCNDRRVYTYRSQLVLYLACYR